MTLMTLIDILNDIDDLPLNNLQVLKPITFSIFFFFLQEIRINKPRKCPII